jgi:hypothetical protein
MFGRNYKVDTLGAASPALAQRLAGYIGRYVTP